MHRFARLWVACLVLVGVSSLSACAASAAAHTDGLNGAVSVSGRFDSSPIVKIPDAVPGNRLVTRTLIDGKGPMIGSSDSAVANFAAYSWNGTTHKMRLSTYQQGIPRMLPAHGNPVPGLQTALRGKRIGSRVLVEVPEPAHGSGTALVLVIDLLAKFSATESAHGEEVSSGGGKLPKVMSGRDNIPKIVIPEAAPPPAFTALVLVRGSGPKIRTGQYVVVQGVALDWRTRHVLTSSWRARQPLAGVIGAHPSQVGIPGLDKGLVGQTVGSRVLLSVPPAYAFGPQGKPQLGVRATDTLVLVVDILGAYGRGA